MDEIDASLSLIAPDGSRIPVRIDNYDPRNGTGTLVRQQGVPVPPTGLVSASSGRHRESRAASRKSEAQPTPSGSGPPLLFPSNADCSEALTAAGPGFTATVKLHQHRTDCVLVSMLHNACVSEAWSCLRAPKANGAFEMITPKALPPSGFRDDSEVVRLIEAHFTSSLAAARARSHRWANEKALAAEQRKRLAKDAAVFFKLGTSSSKPATESSKQAADVEASRLARRSTRKRGREDDSAQPDATADGAVQAEEVQQPSKASKHDQGEEHQQGTESLPAQPDALPASTSASAAAAAAAGSPAPTEHSEQDGTG